MTEPGSFLSGLDFWVTDGPTGGGAAAGGAAPPPNGGFSMSRSEMEAMLTKAQNTRKLIQEQIEKSRNIAQITPPAQDSASVMFTDSANKAGSHYLGHLATQDQHYGVLIKKLSDALGIVVDTDQQAGKGLPKSVGEAG